ncbi:MAG TPA: putative colanic acid biosynthesis acetyltransferase [Croceibacterium sp.]|nr:putative colanic acid biosynthesis acetyltransferase [Croceibacterium sp.]
MSGPADGFRPLGRGAAFPLANKLERLAWRTAWLLLARFTPPQLAGWRALLLRAFGANVGRGTKVYGSARIWLPRNLALGEGAVVGPGAELYNQGRITIGPRCVVSQRAFLCASTHSTSDPGFALVLRPVTLGASCWVAAEAFVGPGVTMADGAVLAARGALFEDAAAMAIYRGNPAELIGRRRFAEPAG